MEQRRIRSKVLAGVLVILLGLFYLLKVLGIQLPINHISWEFILIGVGLVHLVKHNFKKSGGYIMIIIGSIFLIDDLPNIDIDTKVVWPLLIIFFGGLMIYKALFKKKGHSESTIVFDDQTEMTSDQYFESSSIFGGVNKNVVSSDFKGASVTSIFGGTEINLMKADIQENAIIDTTCIFGGTTIIIPDNWQVKNEITTILGSVEDKRAIELSEISGKILILKGSCILGGVDIKSYS